MKIIIIEDEPLMAKELERVIVQFDPNVEIVAKFESVREANAYLSENELPDLFFSDIQLSDGLSFEIFHKLQETVPVIFCTAFDEYALEAFKVNGIDYLLKPFDEKKIAQTLEKYKGLTNQNQDLSLELTSLFESLNNRSNKKKTLLVHQGSKILPIRNEDVRLAYLRNGVTYITTKDNKSHIVNHTLDALDEILGEDFYRANRQIIISKGAIRHVSQFFARKLLVEINISFDEKIIVSKANASSFLKWLES